MHIHTKPYYGLCHFGTLKEDNKGEGAWEGDLISVTTRQNVRKWRRLAHLNEGQLWVLPKTVVLLVVEASSLFGWAKERGLVTKKKVHEVYSYDVRPKRIQRYLNKEEAEAKLQEHREAEPPRPPRMVTAGRFIGTERLQERQPRCQPVLWPQDAVAVTYAMQTDKVDGVWWYDVRDGEALTPPRGGIKPELKDAFTPDKAAVA